MSKTGYTYCADLVKRNNEDRYLAALFAPSDKRSALFALYAFDIEIGLTRFKVSEPILGEIRLQWWRDAVESLFDGAPRRHQVIEALAEILAHRPLPRAPFDALIDAHARDFQDTPMATEDDVLAYAEAISAPVLTLATKALAGEKVCDTPEKAVHSTSRALALNQLLRALPRNLARGLCVIPENVCAKYVVDVKNLRMGNWDESCQRALNEIIDLAFEWLAIARADMKRVPDVVLPAFLPLSLCQPSLWRMSRPGFDPFLQSPDLSLWGRQLRLFRAMITRRL